MPRRRRDPRPRAGRLRWRRAARRTPSATPSLTGQSGGAAPQGGPPLGFPVFATKNTTRVAGVDAIADAAAIALATYPSRTPESHPAAVVLAEVRDWRTGIAAAVLASAPIRAPILFADGDRLPDATKAALDALQPTGSKAAGGAQVIRVGTTAPVEGYRTTDIAGRPTPAALAAAPSTACRRRPRARRRAPCWWRRPIVRSTRCRRPAGPPRRATPVLWVAPGGDAGGDRGGDQGAPQGEDLRARPGGRRAGHRARRPRQARHGQADRRRRPASTAITFARYQDGAFGWDVVDPGHGLVFASTRRPQDAAAAAPLSAAGTYGPLLLLTDAGVLPAPLQDYLLDIQPGYDAAHDPVRGVYNHGWIIGDESAIAAAVQARIDTLLEIQPVDTGAK